MAGQQQQKIAVSISDSGLVMWEWLSDFLNFMEVWT